MSSYARTPFPPSDPETRGPSRGRGYKFSETELSAYSAERSAVHRIG